MFSKQTVNPVAKAEFLTMLKAEWLCFRLNKTPLWRIGKRNRLIKNYLEVLMEIHIIRRFPFTAPGEKYPCGKELLLGL